MSDTQQASSRAISGERWSRWGHLLARPLSQRVHDMGLLPRLLIAEAAVLVILFAGGVLLINRMADSLRDNIKQGRLLLGKVIAEDLDESLSHGVKELQQLAVGYRQAMARGEPSEVGGALDLLIGESTIFTRGILIVGPDGETLGADLHHPGVAKINLQRYWPSLWNQGRKASDVLTSAFIVDGQPTPSVAIAVPAGSGDDGEYVVGLVDTEDSYPFRLVEQAVRLGGSGHADIVDHRAIALFSTETDHVLITSDHPACYLHMLEEGGSVISQCPHAEDGVVRGEPHLMAFAPLKTLPWAISTGTTVSEAFAPVRQLWYGGLGFLVVLMGLAFVATVFVARRLVQPVKALSRVARGVAEGDQTATISIPWGGEIGELARSLETMRRHLEAWASELQERVRERTGELEQRHRELSLLYRSLQGTEEQLRVILGKVLGAQEDERKRVSRELHDGIGQALSALSMGLERLEYARPDQWDRFQEQVEALKELASVTLTDLRRLTIALRPAALDDLGLIPAIRRYAELYLGDAGVDFQVQVEGPDTRLDSSLETVVYRVVQEAINNVARHSGATHVMIQLQITDAGAVATVKDNGRGFDTADIASKRGVGLQGMEERASLAGGKLTVVSHLGHGTMVRLEIPLAEKMAVLRDV